MKKRKIHFSLIYQAILLILMYVPIVVVIVYSFNASKHTTIWAGEKPLPAGSTEKQYCSGLLKQRCGGNYRNAGSRGDGKDRGKE